MLNSFSGYKYLFAHFCSDDKIWYVQPRRFILLKDTKKNVLTGYFLQSSWFQKSYNINTNAIFVIFKVKTDISCKKIEKDMNSLKNPFPSIYDIPPYINNFSYFNMHWQIINQCIQESLRIPNFNFTLRASNNTWHKLSLSIYTEPQDIYNDIMNSINNLNGTESTQNKILITHPSFEIPI